MKKKGYSFLLLASLISLCGCEANNVNHDIKEYVLETNYKSDYKILQLSDLHFSDKDNLDFHFSFIDLTIKEANPDIIIVTGDIFTCAGQETAKKVFEFFDTYKVPWTITFGNHDEQCMFSVDWLTGYLNDLTSSEESYCLFKDIQDDDIQGNSNFAINLMQNNKVFEQLIIVDSNRYNYVEYVGYDYIKDNQIEWYEKLVNQTKADNGGIVVPSLCFMHIPVPEFTEAYNKAVDGDSETKFVINNEDGSRREKECSPDYNSGFFSKIIELGSTKGIFVGHDHINNYCVDYKGVYLSYGVKGTNKVYYDDDRLGGQLITLHDNHSIDVSQIYHTYKEVE